MQFSDVNDLIAFIETSKRFSPKVGLTKMQFLCQLFNHPEKKFNSIHVTGTNGKGSVVSYLASIFRQAGLNVGTFTSPYIVCFNERISFNNQMISDEDLLRIGNLVLSHYDQISQAGFDYPSFFELITIISFIYFSEQDDLDIAIIEVGIGGILDATNVITPLISVITNVAFDHTNVLGPTLSSILTNKLGIAKPNVPLVTGIKNENLIIQCRTYCEQINTPCYFTNPLEIEIHETSILGSCFSINNISDIKINLAGFHQIENALIAIKVINVFNRSIFRKLKKSNKLISKVILKRGLESTKWPGRLEVISENPLVIIDGGHNVDGINRIVEFIKTLPYKTKRCIFACSDDKDKSRMIPLLEPIFDEITFTSFSYKRHSNALELYQLSKHHRKELDLDLHHIITSVWDHPADLNLFIGSLYFVSEIRPLLINQTKK